MRHMGFAPHVPVQAVLPKAMLDESVEVLVKPEVGDLDPVVGPRLPEPEGWLALHQDISSMVDGPAKLIHQSGINELAARWEVLAHCEALPLFHRETQAGGAFKTVHRTMRSALGTKVTAKPQLSLVARVVHRALCQMATPCPPDQQHALKQLVTGQRRQAWFALHLVDRQTPEE